jgi:hypothetical protein
MDRKPPNPPPPNLPFHFDTRQHTPVGAAPHDPKHHPALARTSLDQSPPQERHLLHIWSVLFLLIAQGGSPGPAPGSPQASPRPDTQPVTAQGVTAQGDSARAARRARHDTLRAEREIPVTPALLASAYDGDVARSLIALARSARFADDSSLRRYDAVSTEQLSVKLAIGSFARDRLLLRQQRAEHVQWERGLGAIVSVSGSRTAMPILPRGADADFSDDESIALPYVPGRRTLSLGGERSDDTTAYSNVDDVVDPLALGAEAYYRYSAGDSETIRTPARGGGQLVIHLREIQLHARRPLWNLGTGSLWFDASTGHLVRAIYRFSAPMDIVAVAKDGDPHTFDDVPFWVKPLIMPMTANISVVTLDYRLLEGKYWLPVSRYADGEARVSAMHLPVRWEVHYRYTSINGPDTLPRLPELVDTTSKTPAPRDSSATTAVAPSVTSPAVPPPAPAPGHQELAMRSGMSKPDDSDSSRRHSREIQCAQQSTWQRVEIHDAGAARVLVSTPCDTAALSHSPELPGSIYEEAGGFGALSETDLLKALRDNAVPDWAPRPIAVLWGPRDGLIRYNRIEGPSGGVAATDELGLGLSARAELRFGLADLEPNGGASLTRTSPWGTVTVGAYRRLNSANDWGDPLSFGSSIWNLLVGDDEGFYYRSWGAELSGSEVEGPLPFSWRLFTEHEWGASVATHFDLTGIFGGATMPLRNIGTPSGTITGLSFRTRPLWGLDPNGFQLTADTRGEGAGGSYTYVRGATDLTLTHPVTHLLVAALTAGGGTSAGEVPPQREWYLGGLRTIRGLAPGTESGDAYWMSHLEIATRDMFVRPILFYDIGWAGDRNNWTREGHLLNGAGIGASMLDGLIRVDVGKGIWPTHSVRVNAYLQGAL